MLIWFGAFKKDFTNSQEMNLISLLNPRGKEVKEFEEDTSNCSNSSSYGLSDELSGAGSGLSHL
jgi:hypothetical protein